MSHLPRAALALALLLPTAGVAQEPTLSARADRTVAVFTSDPRELAFSPDGQLLATSSVDSTVRLWRVADGTLARTLRHPEGVTSVAFSRDGNWLATGSYDHAVRVWRLADGALVRTLRGHGGTVWTVAFSPDGQVIASAGEDRTVRLWRAGDGAPLRTMTGHTLNVWSIAFSPDGKHLASGSFDKTIRFWDVATGRLERTLTGPTEAVVHIAFSPDGRWLASGGDDSKLRIWRVADGRVMKVLTGGSEHIYSVAFSADGQWLVSGGRARGAIGTLWHQVAGPRLSGPNAVSVRVWRVRDGALQQQLAGHSDDVVSVAFSPDGKWLASASGDRTVKLWQLSTTQPSARPVVATVPGCGTLDAQLVTKDARTLRVLGTGFSPSTALTTESVRGRDKVAERVTTDSTGRFVAIVTSNGRGGDATYVARTAACEVRLDYRWGRNAW